ncbi:MAG: chromate transporter [Trueperaceae bacterium]|nr:chromate transporter [Trueperaceae bacterium]
MTDLLDLLISFARAGIFGFGGGPSMIPLIQVEVVDLRGWLTPAEFLDAFAFGNALPGPIATKLAGYVGYQVAGFAGAMVALLAITAPTIVAMLALASLYERYRHTRIVRDFLGGVRPVVVALLAVVVWDFAAPALLPSGATASDWPLWLIAAAALVATLRTSLHPALLIVLGGVTGLVFFWT